MKFLFCRYVKHEFKGFEMRTPHTRPATNPRFVTHLEYYAYRIAVRRGFSLLHFSLKLFLQYCIDAFLTVEGNRLEWARLNQALIKAKDYLGLFDYVDLRNQYDVS